MYNTHMYWKYDGKRSRRLPKFMALVVLCAILTGLGYWFISRRGNLSQVPKKPAFQSEPAAKAPEAQAVTGRYLLNGTVTWARAVEQQAHSDFAQPFSQLNTFHRELYDGWSTDFECPITNNVVPYQTQIKNLIFNCRPEFLPAAAKYFNIFDLANNHTDNQGGEKGLEETRKHLNEAGAQFFGTFDAADSDNVCEVLALPVRIQKADKSEDKAALPIAFCGWHYFYRKPAGGEIAIMDKYAKTMPVFAFAEMGTEYQAKADSTQVAIAHQIIEEGPEFLIANNPHWVQNTEVYKGKLIIYSTGNFIFDQLDSETNRSASIDLTINVPYDDNVAKWLALAPECALFHDDCLAKAEKQQLTKINLQLKYGIVAGQNGYKVVTHKADAATQKAVEDRTNWLQTSRELERQ